MQAGYHPESPATLFFGVTVGDVAYWADSLLMAGLLRFAARPFQRLGGPLTGPAPATRGWWALGTETAVSGGLSDKPPSPQELQPSRTGAQELADVAPSRHSVVQYGQSLGTTAQVPGGLQAPQRAVRTDGPAGTGSKEMGYLFQVRQRHLLNAASLHRLCSVVEGPYT